MNGYRNPPEVALLGKVSSMQSDLMDLCTALVAAPSPNPPGDTRRAAAAVAEFFDGENVDYRIEANDEAMPNVIASIGRGEGVHLVMLVHLDTMPPGDEARWTVPVYEMTRIDGKLFGLGMGNMKGAVAAMSVAFAALAKQASAHQGQLTFLGVSDEVVFGPNGAQFLLGRYPDLLGDALICGEGPGWMRLALGEKGVLWGEITTRGDTGHSSAIRRSASAVARMANIIVALDALSGRTAPSVAGLSGGHSDDDSGTTLTANVGTVEAGTFISQIAPDATAQVDFRIPPGMTVDEVEAEAISIIGASPGAAWRRLKAWDANWTPSDHPFVRAFQTSIEAVRGSEAAPAVRLPASDATRWRLRGVPSVCFGPQPTLSAGIDDYALQADVEDCAKIYALAAHRVLLMNRGELSRGASGE